MADRERNYWLTPSKNHNRGALIGSLLRHCIPTNIAIMRDDAGQFNVFDHALYWIHTERLVHRLIPLNEQHKKDVERGEETDLDNLDKILLIFFRQKRVMKHSISC